MPYSIRVDRKYPNSRMYAIYHEGRRFKGPFGTRAEALDALKILRGWRIEEMLSRKRGKPYQQTARSRGERTKTRRSKR